MLDAVIAALGRVNVAVVLNNHCSFAAWGGLPDQNGLWACPGVQSEDDWVADWVPIQTEKPSKVVFSIELSLTVGEKHGQYV